MALDLSFLKKKYNEMLDTGGDALSRVTSNLSPSTIRQIGVNFSKNATDVMTQPFPKAVDVSQASKPIQLLAQGLSNMGGWRNILESNQLKDIPMAFSNPIPKNKLDRIGNSALKIGSEGLKMFQGGYDLSSGLGVGQKITGTGTGGGGKQVARGGINIIESAPFYAGAVKPLAALGYTGLGGGFGYGLSRLQGATHEQALDAGINTAIDYAPKALAMAGIVNATQPGMDALMKTPALSAMPGALKTVAKSVMNVIQGRPIDDMVSPNQTDSEKAMSIAIDAVFPILGDMSGYISKQVAGKLTGINPAKFASSDEAMRAVDAKIKKKLGIKLRKSDGTITTLGKYINKTRPYKKTGETAMGAMFGFEPYQDENGKWSIRFNSDKAAMGMLLMMGGTKVLNYASDAIKEGDVVAEKDILSQLNKAMANSDYSQIKPILDSIPDDAPFKENMMKIFGEYVPKGNGVSANQDLINEARKYKSAEEFIQAQGMPVYHGTTADISIPSVQKASPNGAYGKGIYLSENAPIEGRGYGNKTLELTLNPNAKLRELKGKEYSTEPYFQGRKEALLEVMDIYKKETGHTLSQDLGSPSYTPATINKAKAENSTAYPIRTFWEQNNNSIIQRAKELWVAELKKQGINGLKDRGTIVLFDDGFLSSKSQLTDIYNQSKGNVSAKGILQTQKGGVDKDYLQKQIVNASDELNKVFGVDDAKRILPQTNPKFAPTTSEAQAVGEGVEAGKVIFKDLPDDVKKSFQDFANNRKAVKLEGDVAAKQFKPLDAGGISEFGKIQSGAKGGIYDQLNNYFDFKYKQLEDAGIDMGKQENYLPQLWKENEETVNEVMGKYMGMNPSFTKEKIIESYEAGLKAGLHPRFEKVSDLVKWYEATANKALANKKFFDFLLDNKYIVPKSKAPAGFISLDPDRFKSYKTSIGGDTEFVGTYAASPSIAKLVNNYLQTGAGQGVAKAFSKAKTITLSGGVPKTAINAHGANMLARSTLSDTNPVRGFFTGLHWMLKPDDAAKFLDENLDIALPLVRHGMTLSVEDSDMVRFTDTATLGGKIKNLGNKALELQETLLEDPLFKKMIPALKVLYGKRLYEDLIKSMPEDEALTTAAKTANNMFSGINYDEMGRNKGFQNFLRMLLIAPDWAESNVRVGAGTVKGMVKFGDPHYKAYRIFARNLLGAYITANILNMTLSGKWMHENDKGQQFNIDTGQIDGEGRKVYIKPFGTATDFARLPYEVASGLIQNGGDFRPLFRVLTNRLSTPLGAFTRIALTNQDYLGRPIHSQDKYGNKMPVGQSVGNIANEALTGVGFPNWGRAIGDLATGKSGIGETMVNAFELPIRYGTGATTEKQKMMVDEMQSLGKSGEEINAMLKEEKSSGTKSSSGFPSSMKDTNSVVDEINRQYMDGEISRDERDKAIKGVISKNKTYKSSEDAPKNIFSKTGTYIHAGVKNPIDTAKAILSGQPIRKVVNDAVILERQQNIGAEDLGNKTTVVDHIIPLELGGDNSESNRRTITTEENQLKMKYENQLQKQLSSGTINKKQASQMMLDWVNARGDKGLISEKSLPEGVIDDGINYQFRTTNNAGKRVTNKIPKEFNPDVPKISDTNDLTELEIERVKDFKSEISRRIGEVVKGTTVGIWTQDEAEKAIKDLKDIYNAFSIKTKNGVSYLAGKSGKGKKIKAIKIPKIALKTAKLTKIPTTKMPKTAKRRKYATIEPVKIKVTALKLPTIKLKS